jgi:hypothetical protein
MKSLTRAASIIHQILRDNEIKENVTGYVHRKNERGIDSSKTMI